MVKEIEGEAIFKKLQAEISEAYSQKIYETTKPDELDFLYENAPDFVMKKVLDQVLFENLITLLKWDQKKWFTDSSNAIMKILLGVKDM